METQPELQYCCSTIVCASSSIMDINGPDNKSSSPTAPTITMAAPLPTTNYLPGVPLRAACAPVSTRAPPVVKYVAARSAAMIEVQIDCLIIRSVFFIKSEKKK